MDQLSTTPEDKYCRSQWFRDARFGMFIHWGAYAVPGRGEWVRSVERMSVADYQYAVDAFNPDSFDPHAWAETAAAAGMKYAVLTAKHHDGFCLFDSQLSDYTIMENGCGRDLVREFLDAFRARGIKVGLYFSLLDWHHPDFPTYGDDHHPMRDNPEFADHRPNMERYTEFMHGQVRELCTNYGELDLLWFDFSYGALRSEAWRAEQLMAMVRELQPNVITDNRLETSGEGLGSIVTSSPHSYSGDFVSPEQVIPAEPILDDAGNPVPWESCITLNNHWGYAAEDHDWKDASTIIRTLVDCTSKGGNLLLNVGPGPDGRIPEESVRVLQEVGEWMSRNGTSIYGAGPSSYQRPTWGCYTQAGATLFAHVFLQPIGPLALTGGVKATDIASIVALADGSPRELCTDWVVAAYPDLPFISMGPTAAFTYRLPDAADTVFSLTLNEPSARG